MAQRRIVYEVTSQAHADLVGSGAIGGQKIAGVECRTLLGSRVILVMAHGSAAEASVRAASISGWHEVASDVVDDADDPFDLGLDTAVGVLDAMVLAAALRAVALTTVDVQP